MSISNFIPSLWSPRVLENLRSALVYGGPGVANRDYEGDIRNAGDSVRINNIGSLSVGTYVRDTDLDSPQVLSDESRTLTIDQQKYTIFALDDVDKAQSNANLMDAAMREAGYALALDMDGFLSGTMADEATSVSVTSSTPDKDTAYEDLVDLAIALDEADAPRDGRFVVVPPAFMGLLLRDSRFINAQASGSTAPLLNGRIGQAAGFTVYQSNLTPSGEGTKFIIAGHPSATTVAEQINKVEAYRSPTRFADTVRILNVYGAKVIRPTSLVKAEVEL